MSTWTEITESDLQAALNGTESSEYQSALLKAGQTSPLPGIISQVTAEVRGSVRSCRDNTLDPASESTIPNSLRHHAMAIIRYRLLSGFVGEISAARTEEWRQANRVMEQVRSCSFRIEEPSTAIGEPAPKSVGPSFSTPTRTQSREQANGA